MRTALYIIVVLALIALPASAHPPPSPNPQVTDGTTTVYNPWKITVSSGDVADPADGSVTIDTTGAAGATAWDDITAPDANDEIDFADYIIELKLGSSGDFRIGDGGSDYVKFADDGDISFAGGTDIDLPDDSVDDADLNYADLADLSAGGEVDDDSHAHVYSNIDAFTEANLYTILSDVSQFYEAGDDISADESDPNVNTHAEIIAIIDNTATDVGTGVWTFAGIALSANENITLGAQTLDHDGTDFVFNDDITISAAGPDLSLKPTSGDTFGFHVEPTISQSWISNETDGVHYVFFDADHTIRFGRTGNVPAYVFGAGAINAGDATSLEVPNSTSDLTLSLAGQIGVNETDDQIGVHFGATGEISGEAAISGLRHITATLDPAAWYDQESNYRVVPLMYVGDDAPEGITIVEWKMNYITAPTTDLDCDLMCDTTPDFNPAAGATVMDVLDTSSGASSADTGFDSASCAYGSRMYLRFGADPADANEVIAFDLWFYNEED